MESFSTRSRAWFAWTGALVFSTLLFQQSSMACSICRCGDSTFNALGTEVYSAGKFRFALDWDRFDKESAASSSDVAEGGLPPRASSRGGGDEEVENRFTATLSYSFGQSVTAVVRVPWSNRRLTSTEPGSVSGTTTRTFDLSDSEVYALVRIWSSEFAPGLGKRSWISLVGGVKTAWGRNALEEGGQRLDEHAQPGTGATDFFAGVSAADLLDTRSSLFVSAQYRTTGTNTFGYRYGNVSLLNLAYERKLGRVVDAVVELNYRHAQQDRVDDEGNRDGNTGGDILYGTPRVIVDLGHGLLGRAAVQVPLVRSLYGDQTERAVVSAGLTYLF